MNQSKNQPVLLVTSFRLLPLIAGQGNIIGKYYQKACGSKACSFTIMFEKPKATGVKWCDANTDPRGKCIPDGNIFKGTQPDVRPPKRKRDVSPTARGGLYMTESGVTISSDIDLDPGTVINRVQEASGTDTAPIQSGSPTLKIRQLQDQGENDDSGSGGELDESNPETSDTFELEGQGDSSDDIDFVEDIISHKIE